MIFQIIIIIYLTGGSHSDPSGPQDDDPGGQCVYVLLLSKCLGRTAVAFPTNFCGLDSTGTHGLICPSFCCRAQSVDKYYYAHIFPVHCCLRAYRGFPF